MGPSSCRFFCRNGPGLCPPASHVTRLSALFIHLLTHSPRSGREVEPNGERRRQGAEREEPNDRGAGWMTVKGAATRGLFVWPITVIPALSLVSFVPSVPCLRHLRYATGSGSLRSPPPFATLRTNGERTGVAEGRGRNEEATVRRVVRSVPFSPCHSPFLSSSSHRGPERAARRAGLRPTSRTRGT